MRFVLAFAVLALAGCGGSGWAGNFSGTVTDALTCSDGSSASDSAPATFGITDNGPTVSYRAECGVPVTGDVNGNVATLRPTQCPALPGKPTVSITGGTLTLNGNSLAVDIAETVQTSATCTGHLAGSLTRQ